MTNTVTTILTAAEVLDELASATHNAAFWVRRMEVEEDVHAIAQMIVWQQESERYMAMIDKNVITERIIAAATVCGVARADAIMSGGAAPFVRVYNKAIEALKAALSAA